MILLILPVTRKPVQVALNRLIVWSPSVVTPDKRQVLKDYDWELRDLEGRPHNFRISAGNVVLVNFWATWCAPCIAEMPSFQKLYSEFGDKMDFYFVSSEEPEVLRSFLREKAYNLPVFRFLSRNPEQLDFSALPTTFVISRAGVIMVEKTGAANWNDREFKNLLRQLISE